ncbi:MAG TPA: hypothetical protein VHO06_23565 [Polyangia bacterium]|nr:hypothetical protein [Polyangia bacterium]
MHRLRRPLAAATVLLCCSSFAASGCSFLFVNGPPPQPSERGQDLDCTSSYGIPAVDTGLAVLGLMFLSLGVLPSGGLSHNERILVGATTPFILGVSAIAGYERVAACRDALDQAEPPTMPTSRRRRPPAVDADSP